MSVHSSLSCESPDSNSPTTFQSEPRMRTTLPISAPWNWRSTPLPTISSRRPGVKVRPAMICRCGRSGKAAGSTPRTVMLAPLLTSSLRMQLGDHHELGGGERPAVGAAGDSRLLLDDVGLLAVEA